MELQKLATEIHQNAIEHGWWDEERTEAEIAALIHSEWSEALEEARCGRGLSYVHMGKPEGTAIELIDGVIRIFDYLGHVDAPFNHSHLGDLYSNEIVSQVPDDICDVIAMLHSHTSRAYDTRHDGRLNMVFLITAASTALSWIKKQELSPIELLIKKHEFNKTRPYKHGKQF